MYRLEAHTMDRFVTKSPAKAKPQPDGISRAKRIALEEYPACRIGIPIPRLKPCNTAPAKPRAPRAENLAPQPEQLPTQARARGTPTCVKFQLPGRGTKQQQQLCTASACTGPFADQESSCGLLPTGRLLRQGRLWRSHRGRDCQHRKGFRRATFAAIAEPRLCHIASRILHHS